MEGGSGVDKTNIAKILSDIRVLQKIEVYNTDIREENFKDGLLVDFGSSLTEPNCVLRVVPEDMAHDFRVADLAMFDNMVKEEGILTTVRAMRNEIYCDKLRSRRTRKTTPSSSTPSSSTPGSSTPGSSTPGSSTPGSSTPGS
jgi:hypothetical protein